MTGESLLERAVAFAPPLVGQDGFPLRFAETGVSKWIPVAVGTVTDAASIRSARPDEAAALARLCRDAYATNVELGFPSRAARATRADLESWIRDARVYVAVRAEAAREDALVGMIRYRPDGKEGDPEFGRLAVPPRARGEGIGSTLIEHVEAVARESGADRIRLRTFDGHPFLPELYRRRGYRKTRVRPLEDAPFDVLHMAKPL